MVLSAMLTYDHAKSALALEVVMTMHYGGYPVGWIVQQERRAAANSKRWDDYFLGFGAYPHDLPVPRDWESRLSTAHRVRLQMLNQQVDRLAVSAPETSATDAAAAQRPSNARRLVRVGARVLGGLCVAAVAVVVAAGVTEAGDQTQA